MKFHEKLQYKAKNFVYEQERRKQRENKNVSSEQIEINKKGIKNKINSALDEMDGYLEERLQQIQLPKLKK